MTDDRPHPGSHDEGFSDGFEVKAVYCRRLGKQLPVADHAECSYCYGDHEQIKSADHERFCSYDPERDPIHFGFPGDTTRDTEG